MGPSSGIVVNYAARESRDPTAVAVAGIERQAGSADFQPPRWSGKHASANRSILADDPVSRHLNHSASGPDVRPGPPAGSSLLGG
jgi:hypothetical protein